MKTLTSQIRAKIHLILKVWAGPVIGCVILTLLIARPYLHAGFPYTHDNENHLARFANYKIALKEGQFPPRFAPNLANHYGYPVLNYNYPLANILALPAAFLKINYELIFKVLVVVAIWSGQLGSWVWLSQLGFSKAAKWMSLLSFGFAPFVINLLSIRGNIGELLAMMILPWLLASIERLRKPEKPSSVFMIGMCVIHMAFGLSHNISAVLGLVLLIGYAVWRLWKNWSRLATYVAVLGWAIASTLWFWLPALAEKSLTILDSATVNQRVTQHFATLPQLLFSPLKFGYSYVGQIDSLSFALGLSSLLALVLGTAAFLKTLFQLVRQKKQLSASGSFLGMLLLAGWSLLLLQTQLTNLIYTALPPLNFLQFPWRLALFWQVLLVPVVAIVWDELGKYWRALLVIIICWQVLVSVRVQPVDYFHKTNVDYEAFVQTTSTNNENRPSNYTYQPTTQWQPTPTVATGAVTIAIQRFNGSYRQYHLSVTQPSVIIEPTANFAGWETTANNQRLSYIDSAEVAGRIAFQLEPGEYQIQTRFTQNTLPRQVGNFVSLLSFFTLAGWIGYTAWQNRQHHSSADQRSL